VPKGLLRNVLATKWATPKKRPQQNGSRQSGLAKKNVLSVFFTALTQNLRLCSSAEAGIVLKF